MHLSYMGFRKGPDLSRDDLRFCQWVVLDDPMLHLKCNLLQYTYSRGWLLCQWSVVKQISDIKLQYNVIKLNKPLKAGPVA